MSSRIDSLAGRIFIAIIAIVLGIGLLEAISRKLISPRSPFERRFPVEVWRKPRPYSMFSGQPGAKGLNALGYRGPAPRSPKPDREFRVFFLGGSTAVEGSPPIAELIQGLFHQAGLSNVRVYNFGVISAVSSMELAKIIFEVADLEPDLIVMYDGGNDLYQPLYWDPRPGYPFNFIAYENNPLLDKDIHEYPTLALLAYGSNLMRRLLPTYFVDTFVPLAKTREEVGFLSEKWKQEIVDTYLNNLVKANEVSRAFGARFVAFFQPMVYFKDSLSVEEKKFFDPSECAYLREMRGRVIRCLSDMEISSQVSKARIVDLSGIYRNDPTWIFQDLIHTRQEGKQAVAEAMFLTLKTMVKERDGEIVR